MKSKLKKKTITTTIYNPVFSLFNIKSPTVLFYNCRSNSNFPRPPFTTLSFFMYSIVKVQEKKVLLLGEHKVKINNKKNAENTVPLT